MPFDLARHLVLLATQAQSHAITFLDTDGKLLWFSPGAETIFGHKAEDIEGRDASNLFTEPDIERGVPQQEMEISHTEPAEDDRWQERADGSRFWASGALYALRDADGEIVCYGKLLRNRTSIKEQLEGLRNRVDVLESQLRRNNSFISTLSHELSNPLGPIQHAADIIRRAVEPTQEVEFALRVIDRQAGMLRTLVSDLLEFARLGASKVDLRRERLSLHDVIAAVVQDCRAVLDSQRHEVRLYLTREPIHVYADRDRLHQVLTNLVTNSAKYTPPGGRVSIKATTEGAEAVVRVEDNGVGIPTDMLPRIFELFTQVETTRRMAQGGLGIGLSIVKELVSLHGGSVQAASEGTGKGSEFTVRLPLPRDDVVTMEKPQPDS